MIMVRFVTWSIWKHRSASLFPWYIYICVGMQRHDRYSIHIWTYTLKHTHKHTHVYMISIDIYIHTIFDWVFIINNIVYVWIRMMNLIGKLIGFSRWKSDDVGDLCDHLNDRTRECRYYISMREIEREREMRLDERDNAHSYNEK